MITLMFKSGELEVVKNWRPITLLRYFYYLLITIIMTTGLFS
jgi:hypothetical protein